MASSLSQTSSRGTGTSQGSSRCRSESQDSSDEDSAREADRIMKVRIRKQAVVMAEEPAFNKAELRRLWNTFDPATGGRQQFEPIRAITARTDLEALMSFHLDQVPVWVGGEA